jgi:hypothetical protein
MTTGGTVGYPITGGLGTGLDFAPVLPRTHLTLDRYARIMGVVAPPHFFGSYSVNRFPLEGTCDIVVPRHGWQLYEVVSREEILEQIFIAEQEIAEFLGHYVAPTFVTNEPHQYPGPYDPLLTSVSGLNTAGFDKSIEAKKALIIQPGPRAASLIGTATTTGSSLDYTDEDGDGYIETAKVTFPTTETELCELRCFVPDKDGVDEWEIRTPRRKYLSGGNVVFEFSVWLFINPDLDARYPDTDDYRALDYTDTTNLLDSVDIYRVYVDNTAESARFYWESDPNCVVQGSVVDAGSLVSQGGVAILRDVQSGLLVPRAATYDADQSIWTADTRSVNRDPDIVRVSYYAGDVAQAYLSGRNCDPLKDIYAKAIAYMATARLTRSICSCPGIVVFFESLQEDFAVSTPNRNTTIGFRDLENPFGTRRGELMAWRLIGKLGTRELNPEVAVI